MGVPSRKAKGAFMAGGPTSFDEIAKMAAARMAAVDARREQSTILFPYLDLNVAVEVAKAMHETRGHGSMEAHELAAQMKQTISGAFRLKTGTARIFGLTERDGRDAIKLSPLGRAIIEPETESEARADAFMRVPLYSAIYEKYKGQRLPPPKALEREMQALGVSSKQTDKARQAFERSARQAGFFAKGEDRLVRPYFDGSMVSVSEKPDVEDDDDSRKRDNRGGGGGGGGYHPFVEGLLQTMPEPGTLWTIEGRAAWLEAAANVFKLMYQGDGKITVTVAADTSQKKTEHDL
jgi:hypothetical protein